MDNRSSPALSVSTMMQTSLTNVRRSRERGYHLVGFIVRAMLIAGLIIGTVVIYGFEMPTTVSTSLAGCWDLAKISAPSTFPQICTPNQYTINC
jgi:hypothetical protein